jgi:hypothetical protein
MQPATGVKDLENYVFQGTTYLPPSIRIFKRLSDAGIISITYGQEYQLYSLVNNNLVKEVSCKYEESFRDKIANGYYEMFGELY